jgi:hypothetical protein
MRYPPREGRLRAQDIDLGRVFHQARARRIRNEDRTHEDVTHSCLVRRHRHGVIRDGARRA